MIAVAVVAVVVVAVIIVVIVASAGRRKPSAIDVVRKLADPQDGEFPVLDSIANDAAGLSADGKVAGKLGRFALAVIRPRDSEGLSTAVEQQLQSVSNSLATLKADSATFTSLGSSLAAFAALPADGTPAGTAKAPLTAALAELAGVPGPDFDADDLVGVVARLRGAHPPGADPASPRTAWWSASAAPRVSPALAPADLHAEARAVLLKDMTRLGLESEWTGLPGWPQYAALRDGYNGTLARNAGGMAANVRAAQERMAAALAAVLRSTPLAVGEGGGAGQPAELERIARELRSAVEGYAGQVRAILAAAQRSASWKAAQLDTTPVTQPLDALPVILARCDAELARGDSGAAIAALCGAALPVAASWQPAREYRATWEKAASGVRDLAITWPRQIAGAVTTVAAELERGASQVGTDAEAAILEWRQQGDKAWQDLAEAAGVLKRQAARELADPKASHDAAEPVRAAAAVMCVDDLATRNLAQVLRSAIPVPGTVAEAKSVDEQTSAIDKVFATLDANAELLSGIDGVIAPLLAMTGFDAAPHMAAAMAQFTPVPVELGSSLHDAVLAMHHPLAGVSLEGSVTGLVHYVEGSLVPSLPSLLFSGGDDGPLTAFDVLKYVGKGVGKTYFQQVAKTPALEHGQQQLELAAHHVLHAATLAAPDIIHGVVGHIPFVTLALSTTRELRLYRAEKTTLDQAILNIAVDTGGVFAGITGAELLVHVIAGAHPAGVITIPAGIIGSIVARKFISAHRQHAYKEAAEAYATLTKTYADKDVQLAIEYADTARNAITRERGIYLANIGVPALAQQAAAGELERLTSGLRTATANYAKTVKDLLDEGVAGTPGAVDALGAVSEAKAATEAVGRQARDGEYAPALLTLTGTALPAPAAWRPGREYRELCLQTATRVSELADQHRAEVARWATGATAEFRTRSEAIGSVITAKSQAIDHERAAALAAIEEAGNAVQREADALGIKKKH